MKKIIALAVLLVFAVVLAGCSFGDYEAPHAPIKPATDSKAKSGD